jgi:Zinc finger, C3HC4 type (RING finger)
MGAAYNKILKQTADINTTCTSRRFYEIYGAKLNFTLLSTRFPSIKSVIIEKMSNYSIQVCELSGDNSLSSLLGLVSLKDFEKICNIIYHLISFSAYVSIEEDDLCAICLENPSDTVLQCGHQFCSKDLEAWSLKNFECPLCRQQFDNQRSFVKLDQYQADIKQEVQVCKDLIISLMQ